MENKSLRNLGHMPKMAALFDVRMSGMKFGYEIDVRILGMT